MGIPLHLTSALKDTRHLPGHEETAWLMCFQLRQWGEQPRTFNEHEWCCMVARLAYLLEMEERVNGKGGVVE